MTTDLTARFSCHFGPTLPGAVAVAVSGGSDSTALLVALSDWGRVPVRAVTVDHGLRPAAKAEAEAVARLCNELGIRHDILRWDGWDGTGNLLAAARDARYGLIADWARAEGIADVMLAHTQDDVAETFVMRLRRGAGLDGLSAMMARRTVNSVVFHRPWLEVSRSELQDFLQARGIDWVDDPTNEDKRFERARVRQFLAVLDLDRSVLAETARHLRLAREALGHVATGVARSAVSFDSGDVLIGQKAWADQPQEIQRRLLRGAFAYVTGPGYAPRGPGLDRLLSRGEGTLAGVRVFHHAGQIRVTREWAAIKDEKCALDAEWDRRWCVIASLGAEAHSTPKHNLHVAALGEPGLALCPDRKKTGRPAASLISSPAVWRGTDLLAAPLAGLENGWQVQLKRETQCFFDALT